MALLVAAGGARAADLTCEATVTRTSVPRGGELVLRVTAEGDIGWSADFALPDLPGVRVSPGGTNQSMSVVNGRSRATITRSWYLRVEGADDVTIGPVTVTAAGESCATEPITVTVLPPTAAMPPADTGNRTAPPPPPATHEGDEIFVTLEADKQDVWLGEQVVVSFKYWRRVQPWNNPSYEAPRTEGFWREELGSERTYRQVVNGRAFNVTEIRYALFPARAGELTVEPATLTFPQDVFDRFFNTRRRSRGPRVLRTDPVTIRVRELPTPAPAGFSGLVANDVALAAQVNRDTVPAGDPVDLRVDLRTDGFLKGFAGLTVRAPEGVRLHDASESYDTELHVDRLRGHLELEKVLVPEAAGPLELPPVELVWFDADAGRYRTAAARPGVLEVLPGVGGGGEPDASGFLRSEISRLGEDLAFIHPVPKRLRTAQAPFTGSTAWWLLLAAPALLLGAWRLVLLRVHAERRDPVLRRRRRALATARGLLKEAAAEHADLPGLVVRAACGFVADSEGLPPAAVEAAGVRDFCRRCGRDDLAESLGTILAACEASRYGGDAAAAELRDAPARVASALAELARARRRSPRTGAGAAALVLLGAAALAAAGARGAGGVSPEQLVAEGNQAYTEGALDDAVQLYVAARRAGANDPVLHYNLGTAYARRGELGLALASYERARRLDPRDRDLATNTAWVRRQLRDLELAGGELPPLVRQVVAGVRLLTLDQWGTLSLVMAWCLAGVVALAWGRERFGDGLRRLTLLLTAAAVACLAVTGWRWHGERSVRTAMVAVPEAAVRSGPASSSLTLFEVHDGLPVTLREERDGWVRISLGGDWQGWLPQKAVEPVDAPRLDAAQSAGR